MRMERAKWGCLFLPKWIDWKSPALFVSCLDSSPSFLRNICFPGFLSPSFVSESLFSKVSDFELFSFIYCLHPVETPGTHSLFGANEFSTFPLCYLLVTPVVLRKKIDSHWPGHTRHMWYRQPFAPFSALISGWTCCLILAEFINIFLLSIEFIYLRLVDYEWLSQLDVDDLCIHVESESEKGKRERNTRLAFEKDQF